MKKFVIFLLAASVCCLFLSGQLSAMSITDVDPTDLNFIVSQWEDDALNELLVFEEYDETHLVPYPSHDGYAIVNPQGGYFDKIINYQQDDLDGPWMLDLRIHNSSPYCWSDYHIEFWDEEFLNPLDVGGEVTFFSNDIFQNSSFNGYVIEFWAPDWQCYCQENQILIKFNNLQGVGGPAPGAFGIRQVATTVPEPLTMLGVVLGASGLMAYIRKRRPTQG